MSIIGLVSVSALVAWLLFHQKSAETPIRSIAVLPFKPLNADSRDESLELGMAETLITRLSILRKQLERLEKTAETRYVEPSGFANLYI